MGVIGTTYAYALQKAGHQTEHWVREEKRGACPESLSVRLLDGRNSRKGKKIQDSYQVRLAQPGECYDLILVSVSSNKLPGVIDTLDKNQLEGPVLLFNGINGSRAELDTLMGGREYLLGYPARVGSWMRKRRRLTASCSTISCLKTKPRHMCQIIRPSWTPSRGPISKRSARTICWNGFGCI